MKCRHEDEKGNCKEFECIGCLAEKMGGKKEECDGFAKPLEKIVEAMIIDRIADMKDGKITEEDLPGILANEINWLYSNAEVK